jgi:uncharacterized protein YciI
MIALIGRYLKPVDEVQQHMDAHREWVREHAMAGTFIAAGPQVPPGGGIILTVGASRDDLAAIIAKDPFIVNGVAEYDIREYDMVLATPGTEALQG